MKKISDLRQGDVLDNKELTEIFGCSGQGGMRRSHKTNTLVIVSNHITSIYDDRWVGDVLFYTGMGSTGDQSFYNAQNKTLYRSGTNGVEVHLFEVFVTQQYTYQGVVTLIPDNPPHMEQQTDIEGNTRSVCIFPLELTNGAKRVLKKEDIETINKAKNKITRKLSLEQLRDLATKTNSKPETYTGSVTQYQRSPYVVEYTKRRAQGCCELCGCKAPFLDKLGNPYLETHNIDWLSEGGEDTIENTAALCPNCHKKMHVLDLEEDRAVLNGLVK